MNALKSIAVAAAAVLSLAAPGVATAAPNQGGGFHGGGGGAPHVHGGGGFHAPSGGFHAPAAAPIHSFHAAAPRSINAGHAPTFQAAPRTARTPTIAFGGHATAPADPRVRTAPRSIAGSDRAVSGWDRNRDRIWHGHRYHWNNGAWVVLGDGYYPYDNSYYADSSPNVYPYAEDEPVDAGAPTYGANPPPVAVGPDAEGDSIAADVQQSLASRGYYDGQIDGIAGDATREAITDFQRDNRLPVTGYITRSLLRALGL
jgi:hypothetical protein